ncbi:endo alpha-1,4 polygalactosaminidase [Oceanispirochaeta sp.]|jgi:cysteinyl-tRNA synthetase|uniref:endo alpha-1,4 polygalactosaminidase n=1 Tax=Oceanispirochaeta sp. TaxID=2035350 RepID=UPI0026154CCD|nr:endo alpha-1,4 polygalactosaminidase [Oceanispirochaeta sp.]MDA3957648.1 endo alpha-1,4 polygalactosaminidase [Oceanispirochaeta sp.]
MRIPGLILFSVLLLLSCSSTEKELPKPEGNSDALAVYNQAYHENFEPDSLSLILEEAENAYILLDPFQDEDISDALPPLKARGNQLAAYISIGTGEDWRSDFDQIKPFLAVNPWGDWEGEYFVSQTDNGILVFMKARIDKIAAWGFDWVEFDNMDWIFDEETRNEYALEATEAQGLTYVQALRSYAVGKGLKCMAKNWRSGAENFDGVTFESYSDDKNWWESSDLQDFLAEKKPGIIVHYNERDCDGVYREYMGIYGESLSYIAESRVEKAYIHYNGD